MPLTYLSQADPWVQATVGLVLLVLLAIAIRVLALWLFMPVLRRVRAKAQSGLFDVVLHDQVLHRVARVLPSLVVQLGVWRVPHLDATLATVLANVAMAFMVVQVVRALMAMLDVVLQRQEAGTGKDAAAAAAYKARSIKSYIQLAKLVLLLGGTVVTLASLMDKSPLIVLSGLGAMSAVLMLVFKDTILSFTAGVLLTSNDMLRLGDWIEMPQVGADGDVIDMALHTVKVQNWDKTITTIPTWRLMSESYKNWRGMSESGGRRIKRTLRLDASSVRFLDAPEIAQFSRFALLQDYMGAKSVALDEANTAARQRLGDKADLIANQRRLTNLGTLRAYVEAYLRCHPRIHQEMTLMVRTLEPTPEGVPLELYCFTNITAWALYEGVQGDIFDHLLAILPEFGLRLYQSPSGHDLRLGLAPRAPAEAPAPA
ncbi:MAG: mechanosensitive ion channel family protein [Giesbergeria sp.]|nr:mechanosensitive ion channel family protein [Giesbergeria sp.]